MYHSRIMDVLAMLKPTWSLCRLFNFINIFAAARHRIFMQQVEEASDYESDNDNIDNTLEPTTDVVYAQFKHTVEAFASDLDIPILFSDEHERRFWIPCFQTLVDADLACYWTERLDINHHVYACRYSSDRRFIKFILREYVIFLHKVWVKTMLGSWRKVPFSFFKKAPSMLYKKPERLLADKSLERHVTFTKAYLTTLYPALTKAKVHRPTNPITLIECTCPPPEYKLKDGTLEEQENPNGVMALAAVMIGMVIGYFFDVTLRFCCKICNLGDSFF